jgi:methylated-DNA-[protein]-cysteine S-methyltransferase
MQTLHTTITRYTTMTSPVGELLLTTDGTGLTGLHMPSPTAATERDPSWQRDDPALSDVVEQLQSYFAGTRRTFDVALAPRGTPFQLKVWEALRAIPYGTTVSYGELAEQIGNPKASRAVGLANGRNPIGIIVPCHRVIGANGSLTGYGGGLENKRILLDLEARVGPTGT